MASTQLSATRRRRATWVPYLPYLIPGVIAFVVVIGYPLVMNIYYSLFKWKGGLAPMRWYGLDNYADLLADEAFWTSFRNSISMIVAMVIVPTLIGLVLAAVLFDYLGTPVRPEGRLRAAGHLLPAADPAGGRGRRGVELDPQRPGRRGERHPHQPRGRGPARLAGQPAAGACRA